MANQIENDKEQELVEQTCRLMRWEAKAWLITAIVCLSIGSVSTVIFFPYAVAFGGVGVVSIIAYSKTAVYISNFDSGFAPAYDRCSNVGMLVFTALFNEIALIFFLINFITLRSNRAVVDSILAREKAVG